MSLQAGTHFAKATRVKVKSPALSTPGYPPASSTLLHSPGPRKGNRFYCGDGHSQAKSRCIPANFAFDCDILGRPALSRVTSLFYGGSLCAASPGDFRTVVEIHVTCEMSRTPEGRRRREGTGGDPVPLWQLESCSYFLSLPRPSKPGSTTAPAGPRSLRGTSCRRRHESPSRPRHPMRHRQRCRW